MGFIAAYHYIRIFNSWVDAYHYAAGKDDPVLTGVPFNDAYRYMDWLLTVPLLLIEILLVMKLDDETYSAKAWTLGFGSALMIVSGYYGELVVTGDLTPRWLCWFLSMMFFLYIVYELLVGLAAATNNESDPVVKSKIQSAQVMTVISWCTYPVVYLIPMLVPDSAAKAVVGIQIGYCASDIISKCGVGLLIYQITYAKSSKRLTFANCRSFFERSLRTQAWPFSVLDLGVSFQNTTVSCFFQCGDIRAWRFSHQGQLSMAGSSVQ